MVVRWLVKTFITVLVVVTVALGLWTWGALNYVYSRGERAGYVQKFSQKGWLFKTWEGELAMVNLPGTMPEKFYFTVRKPDVAERIEKTLGQRVVLLYNEHKGIPTPIFGDTSHFVTNVRSVDESTPPDPLATGTVN